MYRVNFHIRREFLNSNGRGKILRGCLLVKAVPNVPTSGFIMFRQDNLRSVFQPRLTVLLYMGRILTSARIFMERLVTAVSVLPILMMLKNSIAALICVIHTRL